MKTVVLADLAPAPQEGEPYAAHLDFAQVKQYLKVDPDYYQDDELIVRLTRSVQAYIEKHLQVCLHKKRLQTDMALSWQDMAYVQLPFRPVIEIEQTEYYDNYARAWTAFLNGDVVINYDTPDDLGITRFVGLGLPRTFSLSSGYTGYQTRIVYTCGYGEPQTEPVPDEIKLAIMQGVHYYYENRQQATDTVNQVQFYGLPAHIKGLVAHLKPNVLI